MRKRLRCGVHYIVNTRWWEGPPVSLLVRRGKRGISPAFDILYVRSWLVPCYLNCSQERMRPRPLTFLGRLGRFFNTHSRVCVCRLCSMYCVVACGHRGRAYGGVPLSTSVTVRARCSTESSWRMPAPRLWPAATTGSFLLSPTAARHELPFPVLVLGHAPVRTRSTH